MKTFTFAAAVLAFGTSGALADKTVQICPQDCPAYVESENKDSLTLADIQQMCSPLGSTVRLVVDCSDKE